MRKWMIIFFIAVSPALFAQELLMPELPETDSLEMELEREILYRQLLSGSLMSSDLMQPMQLPDINFNDLLSERWSFDTSVQTINTFGNTGFSHWFMGMAPAPFIHSGSVFSSATYKLNDRFTVGGYSFGAKSVFTAPFPNQGINNYDMRGSTMFLKYNVSKNFKIETRVSVTQGPGPGF